jgi:hypothetical protein
VDDTIIHMDNDLERVKNMMLFLSTFEQLSRLKIKFHKSEISVMGSQRSRNSNILKSLDAHTLPF